MVETLIGRLFLARAADLKSWFFYTHDATFSFPRRYKRALVAVENSKEAKSTRLIRSLQTIRKFKTTNFHLTKNGIQTHHLPCLGRSRRCCSGPTGSNCRNPRPIWRLLRPLHRPILISHYRPRLQHSTSSGCR